MSTQFIYTLNASFITDRELSEEELNAIVFQVAPQIEEPVTTEGAPVEYVTKLIACEVGSLLIEDISTWDKFQEELKEKSLCGACGQYYEENEQGKDGYHSEELCDANDEIKGE